MSLLQEIRSQEQLTQCILIASSSDITSSRTASSMLDAWRIHSVDGGSGLCIELLKARLLAEAPDSVQNNESYMLRRDDNFRIVFFALSTLQQYLMCHTQPQSRTNTYTTFDREEDSCLVTYNMRLDLRLTLFQYIQHVSVLSSTQITPKYLRTKIGLIFALLIQRDFPDGWNDAFDQLIQYLIVPSANNFTQSLPPTVHDIFKQDLFLCTLIGFCDEVVDDTSIEKNTRIKDLIRGFDGNGGMYVTANQSIVARIVEAVWTTFRWYEPYVYMANPVPSHRSEASTEMLAFMQHTAIRSIQVLTRFVSWVDLSLVTHPHILSTLARTLQNCGTGDANSASIDGTPPSQLAEQALHYYHDIINRGMEEDKKIQLIYDVDILQTIYNSGIDLNKVDETHIRIVIKVAEIVNAVGLEIFPQWEACSCRTDTPVKLIHVLQQVLVLFFQCFAYDDIDVSGSVIPLALRFVQALEKKKQLSLGSERLDEPILIDHLPQLLTVMYNQMKYPNTFQFDYEDEEEAEEEVYRTDLRKLYKTIVRVYPDVTLQFLCTIFSNLSMPISSSPTSEIEASLRLVFHYCEGIRPPPGVHTSLKNDEFKKLLLALHESDICMHPHREILILYYDISVRYSSILTHRNSTPLSKVLSAITGSSGIQHINPRVRSRSCYLLLKLVLSLGKVMRPYVETVVLGIQGLLFISSELPIEPDDALYLFETVGLLVANTELEASQQCHFLTLVIKPHIKSIEEILSSPALNRDPDHYGKILSNNVAAIAYLTKGYTNQLSVEVENVLLQTFPVCEHVLASSPSNSQVRSKIMIYLQRMISCVGSTSLDYLHPFIITLVQNSQAEDINDVSQLLYQICMKFKQNAIRVIDGILIPFLSACEKCIPNTVETVDEDGVIPPHHITEQVSFKRMMYAFLYYIVTNDLSSALISPTNTSSLEVILQMMYDGAVTIPVSTVKKYCIQFFRALLRQWGSDGALSIDRTSIQVGFLRFVYDIVVPHLMAITLLPSFNEKDAADSRTVRDIGSLLYDILEIRGAKEFQTAVLSKLKQAVPLSDIELDKFQAATSAEDMTTALNVFIAAKKSNKP